MIQFCSRFSSDFLTKRILSELTCSLEKNCYARIAAQAGGVFQCRAVTSECRTTRHCLQIASICFLLSHVLETIVGYLLIDILKLVASVAL